LVHGIENMHRTGAQIDGMQGIMNPPGFLKTHAIQGYWVAGTAVAKPGLNSRNDVAFSVTVKSFITGQRRPP
jgi:hypothetical protein